jgi:hypothetical protein
MVAVVFLSLISIIPDYSEAGTNPYLSSHGVNFAIGNKYHKDTDISLTTPTGTLSFSRHYNSKSSVDGTLGQRWTHSYSDKIVVSTDNQQIRYTAPTGRVIDYVFDSADNKWIKEVGQSTYIVKVGDEYELKENNGRTLLFLADGSLKEITDRIGNTLTFGYLYFKCIWSIFLSCI